jgi:hypothetical protein
MSLTVYQAPDTGDLRCSYCNLLGTPEKRLVDVTVGPPSGALLRFSVHGYCMKKLVDIALAKTPRDIPQ